MGLLGGCQREEADPKVRHAGQFVKKGQIRIIWGLRRCYGHPSDPKFGTQRGLSKRDKLG